jgi:hypothetical protein
MRFLGLVSGALAGLLVTAAPAFGVIYYPMKAEQTVRIAPSTIADAMGTVWNGELVEIHCQDRGSSVGGSTLWDYIQYNVDGTGGLKKRGWVPDYYVKTGTTEPLPHVRQGDCPPPQTTPGPAVDPPPLRSAPPTAPSPPAPAPAPPPMPEPAPQPACGPAPAVGGHQLHVAIRRGRPVKAITTRYGRAVTVSGSLATPAGAPVAGAPICIAARNVDSRAMLRATRYIVTDAEGRFTYRLESGPSRRVWFVHGSEQGAVADSVLVRVRASVSLRGSSKSLRNGDTLVMRGRLRGRPRRRGVLVELQARRPTGWQTFGTTSTGSGGRFSYAYRFTRTVGVEHYLLRARVRAQPSHYPYATGASQPLRVRVVG